ncbi:MAG: DUF2089 family protein [Planctomycetaceae bacterium]|nr:DUF2089 family protein [Planctomycetaceae bacterium]
MACSRCEVAIEADFPVCRLAHLPTEHQRFIEMFVLAGGNLKEIAQQTGVSYPTIRSRLQKVIEALREEIRKSGPTRGNVLDALLHFDDSGKNKTASVAESASRLIKRI